jgi:nucleotide sugar dehydrogenase
MSKICVIGTGYVGLVTGTCFADLGNDVICLDVDLSRVENLRKGIMPIYEPGLQQMVSHNAEAGRLTFTTDYQGAIQQSEIAFIAVGTPRELTAKLTYNMSALQPKGLPTLPTIRSSSLTNRPSRLEQGIGSQT